MPVEDIERFEAQVDRHLLMNRPGFIEVHILIRIGKRPDVRSVSRHGSKLIRTSVAVGIWIGEGCAIEVAAAIARPCVFEWVEFMIQRYSAERRHTLYLIE